LEPMAARPTPGAADICLIADADAATIAAWLHERGVSVEEGPVVRTGALGPKQVGLAGRPAPHEVPSVGRIGRSALAQEPSEVP